MIRVLHVLEAARGGTSRHVEDVVRSAPSIAHHVVVPRSAESMESGALVDTEAIRTMAAMGAVIHPINMHRSTVHPGNPVAAVRIARLCRRLRPDVLHGHSSVGGALARVVGARCGVPVVYTPNALATGRVVVRIERLLGRATDRLIAVSPSEADLALQLRLLPSERVQVIPNGIDLEPPAGAAPVDLRRRLGLAPDTRLVGTVARLVPQKAPQDFVAAIAELGRTHPDVHGLLIGMGPLQPVVDELVAAHGLAGRFHQIEVLPKARDVLDQLDVFVLPSRFEGAPYTPLEAMRAGVPVVLTDVVGNHDVVEDGVSGYLVPAGATGDMAAAAGRLLDDGALRRSVVAAATRRLHKSFDLASMGADLTDLYRSLR